MTGKQPKSGVRFERQPTADAVGQVAARIVADCLAQTPGAALVFPTGKTPLPMYAALRADASIRWEESRHFQLDEYVPPPGPCAYEPFSDFMDRELWRHVAGQKFYLQDYMDDLSRYEALVMAGGGPDLIILGIGANGHIAFNEPGSPPDSGLRTVTLAQKTLDSNFGPRSQGHPTQAVTLGLRNILAARHVVLLATGAGKQDIVRRAFDPASAPTIDCPASWLKTHPHVTVLTDFDL